MRTAAPPGGGFRASAGAALAPCLGSACGPGFFAVFLAVLVLAAACLFFATVTLRHENEGMRRARHSPRSALRPVRTHWEERALPAGSSACGRAPARRPRFRAFE